MVSIVIPTYNMAEFVGEAVQSCLNQTYGNLEIIVIDDGSTDKTEDILKSYIEEGKIKYFSKENGGCASARNFGLRVAKGEYLMFLDSDDLLSSETVAVLREYLVKHQDVDVAYCSIKLFNDQDLDTLYDSPRLHHYSGNIVGPLLRKNFVPGDCAMIRRTVYKNVFFNEDPENHVEDYDFWLKVAFRGHIFHFVKNTFVLVRNHHANKSRNIKTEAKGLLFCYNRIKENIKDNSEPLRKLYLLSNLYIGLCRAHIACGKYSNALFNIIIAFVVNPFNVFHILKLIPVLIIKSFLKIEINRYRITSRK